MQYSFFRVCGFSLRGSIHRSFTSCLLFDANEEDRLAAADHHQTTTDVMSLATFGREKKRADTDLPAVRQHAPPLLAD